MIDWLTDTLIATSALMALVLVIREPVRRRFGAMWPMPCGCCPPRARCCRLHRRRSSGSSPAVAGAAGRAHPRPHAAQAAGAGHRLDLAARSPLWLAGRGGDARAAALPPIARQRRGILAGAVQLATLDGIRIVRSEQVRGPLAFGILDRVIVVPLDFDQKFTDRQRCLALDHELAHHRCGDLVANLFAFVLLCLQWFNPLAWAAHAAFRFDQEAACDARVLDKAEPGERASYGAAIAKAASGRTLLFAGALDRPSTLSRRLTIMTCSTHQTTARASSASRSSAAACSSRCR